MFQYFYASDEYHKISHHQQEIPPFDFAISFYGGFPIVTCSNYEHKKSGCRNRENQLNYDVVVTFFGIWYF